MPNEKDEIVFTIVAVVAVLLFIGFLFLVLLLYYNNKKKKVMQENDAIRIHFEKQLLQSQLELQEDIFNTISQEIHDNVGQVLSLAKVQVNILSQKDHPDKELLAALKTNLGTAMSDLRDIASSLNSDRIAELSLEELAGDAIARLNRGGNLTAQLSVSGTAKPLASQKKLLLFRIMQECFQNVLKHAEASLLEVKIDHGADELNICIRDNGTGFDVAKRGKGIGIFNIMNRTALMNGSSVIESEISSGTHVRITIPYEPT
ncbi:MAG: sensor histidine kinase [Chitinophagaceae bacterium]